MEIITDMEEIVHRDYLRVTIRSKGTPFKGFLVKAVEALNTDTQCKFVRSDENYLQGVPKKRPLVFKSF